MNTNTKQQFITVPLTDLVYAIIGDPNQSSIEYAPISPTMALVLSEALKATPNLGVVAFENFDGEKLETPLLWNCRCYWSNRSIHRNQHDYKHKQRVKWQLEVANQEKLTTILMSKGLPKDRAKALAVTMLSNDQKQVMAIFGMTEFVTKEEEL